MFFCLNNDLLPKITYIGANQTASDWKHPVRTLEDYILYIIKDGEMHIREDQHAYCLEKGDMLLLEPGKTLCGTKASACNYYYIHITTQAFSVFDCSRINQIEKIILDNRNETYRYSPFSTELYSKSQLFIPKDIKIASNTVFARIETELNKAINSVQTKQQHFKLICSCKFIEVLSIISEYFATERLKLYVLPQNNNVDHIVDFLNRHYAEKITSDYISQKIGMNFDYLNRIFKKQMGMTIFAYRNHIRIDKAKELLVTGNMMMRDIAVMTGFNDEYRFSKVFKQSVGVSPSNYLHGELM